MNTRIITLRIKKKYFSLLQDGTKRIEFRGVKPFYNSLFKNVETPFWMRLHYQDPNVKLYCYVVSVRQVSKREAVKLGLDDLSFFTDCKRLWAIFIQRTQN